MMQIYLARDNEQAGPYTLEQVNSMLASGQVVLSDLAWHEGLDNWQPLGQLTGGRLYYSPHGASPFASAPATPTAPSHTASSAPVNLSKTSPAATAPIASVGKRLLGALIDNLLMLLAMFPALRHLNAEIFAQQGQTAADLQALIEKTVPSNSLMLTGGLMFGMLVLQGFLIITRGQSIGKIIMKTRIVDQTTRVKTGVMNSFVIRTLLINLGYNLPVVGLFVLLIDLGMMLFSEQRISLHDRLANTLVLEARPEQLPNKDIKTTT